MELKLKSFFGVLDRITKKENGCKPFSHPILKPENTFHLLPLLKKVSPITNSRIH